MPLVITFTVHTHVRVSPFIYCTQESHLCVLIWDNWLPCILIFCFSLKSTGIPLPFERSFQETNSTICLSLQGLLPYSHLITELPNKGKEYMHLCTMHLFSTCLILSMFFILHVKEFLLFLKCSFPHGQHFALNSSPAQHLSTELCCLAVYVF